MFFILFDLLFLKIPFILQKLILRFIFTADDLLYLNIRVKCPGHDVKLYPGVRLDNQKVLCAPGPRAEKKKKKKHCFIFNKL